MKWLPLSCLFLVIAGVVVAGCSREKLDELAAKTKAATADAAAQIKQAGNDVAQQSSDLLESSQDTIKSTRQSIEDSLPDAGSIRLQTQPAIATNLGRWTLLRCRTSANSLDQRVIEITSYRTSEPIQNWPAVMLRGILSPSASTSPVRPTELDNAQWDLFAQPTADGPVWSGTVRLEILSLDQSTQQLRAVIDSTTLTSTDEQTVSLDGGELDCKWIAPAE